MASTLLAATAPGQELAVTSGASYEPWVAPDSIAAVFALDFKTDTSLATLDDQGRLPLELGGVAVTIADRPAELLFVSSRQINLIVPAGTPAGDQEAIVRLPGGERIRGRAAVRDVSPALFSLDATGSGPGAILNAVTNRLAPFAVLTPEIVGSDQRTRLALFGTGLRQASSVDALAVDPLGDGVSLQVEFAGPAPGFFGLDQVNVVLDPLLDGAGATSLRVVADGRESRPVTAEIAPLPEDERPTTPRPPARAITTSPDLFPLCSAIPGQPSEPCLAYPFEHQWSASTSPHGVEAYELRTALGRAVTVSGEQTTFVEWRVQLGDVECSPEPSTQTFPWSVRAVDTRGIRSGERGIGEFVIGPCPE